MAVLLVIHFGRQYFQQQQEQDPPQAQAPYAIGDQIVNTSELRLQDARLTLLIGTASTGPYCTASMPFYERLVTAAKEHRVKVAGFAREDVSATQEYLARHSVVPDAVISAETNGLTLPMTPLLLAVDGHGNVVGAWTGRLNADSENDVLEGVRGVERASE